MSHSFLSLRICMGHAASPRASMPPSLFSVGLCSFMFKMREFYRLTTYTSAPKEIFLSIVK